MAMLTITLDPASVEHLVGKLGRATALATLVPPMQRALARLHDTLATYPSPSRTAQPARSRKQRIKQILLGKEGKIPYRRTGDLGRSWTSEVTTSEGGLEGALGNSVRSREDGRHYGPLVEGSPGVQSSYHAGTWPTIDAALRQHEAAIVDDFANAIDRALAS